MRELKVLLIEDEENLCKIIMEAVNTACGYEGCEVFVEYSKYGADGLAKYKSGEFDLVIVDLSLPDISGMDVIRKIRQDDKIVEFIVITEYPTLDTAVEAISLDVWAYFTKPFQMNELVDQAKRAIDHSILKKKILNLAEWADRVLGNGGD